VSSVRLRDFSTAAEGIPTLITDFAPHHSLVAALQDAGIERIFLTDWRSASPDMRFLSIDNYLADLNVLVDWLGGSIDLVGLCQGG
jgi:poly(3-hydroxyalkanoate) synthetase